MTHQERFIESLTFGRPDRLMLWQLFGLLPGVLERWVSEGMPAPDDASKPLDVFGFDPVPVALPANTSAYPALPSEVLEDTPEYTISRDGLGRTVKLIKASASIPLPLDFPVCSPADWERMKPLFAYSDGRVSQHLADRYDQARRQGLPVIFATSGFYNFPRQLMGDECLAYAYYDHPQMVADMQETYTRMVCAVAEVVLSRVEVDAVYFHEDMAYRGGVMISPLMFEHFLAPYYRRVVQVFRSAGVRIFAVDSDGFVGSLAKLLTPLGVNTMFPFEVRAGNDIRHFRRDHGEDLAIVGGLDKFCVTKGRSAIDGELEKLAAMKAGGGYIASLDHRVMIETPFKDYLYYVEQAKRMLGI